MAMFTVINESVREHFDISRDEYALCDFIVNNTSVNSQWCVAHRWEMAEFVGITGRGIAKMVNKLCGLAILERGAIRGYIRASDEFKKLAYIPTLVAKSID